ncbi:hypothetical protein BS78_07G216400 [Paspalum vaginatum]|nr:hypothetical protein BS78_07G216400 [Paspalum vaginatum]
MPVCTSTSGKSALVNRPSSPGLRRRRDAAASRASLHPRPHPLPLPPRHTARVCRPSAVAGPRPRPRPSPSVNTPTALPCCPPASTTASPAGNLAYHGGCNPSDISPPCTSFSLLSLSPDHPSVGRIWKENGLVMENCKINKITPCKVTTR